MTSNKPSWIPISSGKNNCYLDSLERIVSTIVESLDTDLIVAIHGVKGKVAIENHFLASMFVVSEDIVHVNARMSILLASSLLYKFGCIVWSSSSS
ncbi:hypothetical protein SDJN03_14608, partial [Cucurbita argyrosperma subsp. sororia]